MSREVFSIKLDEELRNKIKELIDQSGEQGNTFMENLIKLYEINNAKDIMPSAMGDVEELQTLTKRMYDIFTGLIERSSNLIKDRESVLKEEIEKKSRSINVVQEKLDARNRELETLKTAQEEFISENEELKKKLQEFDLKVWQVEQSNKEIISSKDALIEEYKEKNDNLSGILLEYQQYKDKNKELLQVIDVLKAEIDDLKLSLSAQQSSEEKLKAEIELLRSQHKMSLERADMEKEKAILELRKEYQSKFETLSNEHNLKIKGFLDEIEMIKKQGDNTSNVTIE